VEQAPLRATHCRLIGSKIHYGIKFEKAPSSIVQHSEILGNVELYHGIDGTLTSSSRLSLENNLILSRFHGIRFHQNSPALEKATIVCRHNTVESSNILNFDTYLNLKTVADAAQMAPGVVLEITGNILVGTMCLAFRPHGTGDLEKAAPLLPKLLSIQDQGNLYALRGEGFLTVIRAKTEPASYHPSLADWIQFWSIAKSTSLVGKPIYQGGNVYARTPDQLTPADFRLANSSPGKGKGGDGKDLGADVDRVGPGKPYEEWKKTDEYRKWQKETEAMLHEK
jgi:hypothetical protein